MQNTMFNLNLIGQVLTKQTSYWMNERINKIAKHIEKKYPTLSLQVFRAVLKGNGKYCSVLISIYSPMSQRDKTQVQYLPEPVLNYLPHI